MSALQRLEELAAHVTEPATGMAAACAKGFHIFCENCEHPIPTPKQGKKFCCGKCRDAWHSTHRDYEPRNTRVEFALTMLRFMEKQFPAQTAKMRQGFDKKRREKNG